VGVAVRDNRLFVEVVLYRHRTGMPWRDLPERFGDGGRVHRRFSRWAKSGVWERMFQYLAVDADNESLSGHIPRSSLRSSDLLPFYHQYPAACCGDFLLRDDR
jgi:transposase